MQSLPLRNKSRNKLISAAFCCTCCILIMKPCSGQYAGFSPSFLYGIETNGVPRSYAGGQLGHVGVSAGMSNSDEQILWQALNSYDSSDWESLELQHLPHVIDSKVPMVIEEQELDLLALSPSHQIESPPPPGRLLNRLRLVLEPLELTVCVKRGVLVITSRESAEDDPSIRIYDVAPLLVEVIDSNTGIREVDWRSLKSCIQANLDPYSWYEIGGTSVMCPLEIPGRRLLVVSAPTVTHIALTDMLKALVASANSNLVSHPGAIVRVQRSFGAPPDLFQPSQILHAPEFPLETTNNLPRPYLNIP